MKLERIRRAGGEIVDRLEFSYAPAALLIYEVESPPRLLIPDVVASMRRILLAQGAHDRKLLLEAIEDAESFTADERAELAAEFGDA